jgi:alpha-tubulin suppressor-like RCC1 family protein
MNRAIPLALAVALSLGACSDQNLLDLTEAPAPDYAISDGSSGGNEHFFFLPPMVKSASYSGTFDPTVSPVVVIKQGENELGQLEATLDEANELYQANWHTNDYDLSTDGIYRLSVQIDGYELGFADIDMVENGAGLRHVQSDSYIGLVDGRTLPVKFRVEENALPSFDVLPEFLYPMVVGSGYSIPFMPAPEASGTWSVRRGALPSGLALSSDGVLSGAPETASAGSNVFALRFDESSTEAWGERDYDLFVAGRHAGDLCDTPKEEQDEALGCVIRLDPMFYGESYAFELDGDPGAGRIWYPYDQEAAEIFAGLGVSVGLDGALSSDDVPGGGVGWWGRNVTVVYPDGSGRSIPARWITLERMTLADEPLPEGETGKEYSYDLPVSGGPGEGYTVGDIPALKTEYTVIDGALPAGLSLDAETGIVAGTPTGAGDFTFTIEVRAGFNDGSGGTYLGQTLSRQFSLLVTSKFVPVASAASSSSNNFFVTESGDLWGMGRNLYGSVGDGSAIDRSLPVRIASDVRTVSAGSQFALFIKSDGSLWGFGENGEGQLGDGTFIDRFEPVWVMDGVSHVSAGGGHSMILKADGTLWATGRGSYGQLGDGRIVDGHRRNRPIQVMSGVSQVAAGGKHTVILKDDGSLWGVGSSTRGQLGLGIYGPVQDFTMITDGVVYVSSGVRHTMFVKSDGSLWGMGSSGYGDLGNGSRLGSNIPVQIMGGVRSVSAGDAYSMILLNDDRLLATGANFGGQLGDGTTGLKVSPIEVFQDVRAVFAGNSTLIIKNDGTFWLTGSNAYGQLGDGTTTNRLVPLQLLPPAN